MTAITTVPFSYDIIRSTVLMETALEDRLRRAVTALKNGNVPHAVIGGLAVRAWVGSIDPTRVRSTVDADILLDQSDLENAKVAMANADFHFRHAAGIDFFRDGPKGKFGEAVHIIFAGRKVREEYDVPAPQISECVDSPNGFPVLTLAALLTMKLTSFRLKDQVHILDLIGVGLVDESFMDKVPEVLRPRLRQMLDSPEIERTPEGVDDPD
jgi:hypothetical protein